MQNVRKQLEVDVDSLSFYNNLKYLNFLYVKLLRMMYIIKTKSLAYILSTA